MDPSEWEQVGSIQDSDNNGVMVSNLPLLFANSEPTSLQNMTQRQLERFVRFMVHCSVGEELTMPWSKLARPSWWPNRLPYKLLTGTTPTPSHRSMLQRLVERCYQYHGCEFLLQFCRSLVQQKPSNGYRFTDNRDGTTSMHHTDSGKLLVTFRNENREYDMMSSGGFSPSKHAPGGGQGGSRPQLLPRRSAPSSSMMVRPAIHDVYLCDRCDREFGTLQDVQTHERECGNNNASRDPPRPPPSPEPEVPDLPEQDPTDQVAHMHQLSLQPASHTGVSPYSSPVKRSGGAGRRRSQLSREHQLAGVRKLPRGNYFRYESVDLASPLGRMLRKSVCHQSSNTSNSQQQVLRYERHLAAAPDASFPQIRDTNRGLTRWVIVYRNPRLTWYHPYSFTRAQRCERWLTIETGIDLRARMLFKLCRPCRVVAKRVPKRVIDRYTWLGRRKAALCIDLTCDEAGAAAAGGMINLGGGCMMPLPTNAAAQQQAAQRGRGPAGDSAVLKQILDIVKGNCNWTLAPGFLEHVIAGGEVPDNIIAATFKKLFAPNGLLVYLLNDSIKNNKLLLRAIKDFGTTRPSLEQYNALLTTSGTLKDVAFRLGSSKVMAEFVVNFSHVLCNPQEMLRLTSLPPNIVRVTNSEVSSALANASYRSAYATPKPGIGAVNNQFSAASATASNVNAVWRKPGPKSRKKLPILQPELVQYSRRKSSSFGPLSMQRRKGATDVVNLQQQTFVVDNLMSNSAAMRPYIQNIVVGPFAGMSVAGQSLGGNVSETIVPDLRIAPDLRHLTQNTITDQQLCARLQQVIKQNLAQQQQPVTAHHAVFGNLLANDPLAIVPGPYVAQDPGGMCENPVIDVIDLSSDEEVERKTPKKLSSKSIQNSIHPSNQLRDTNTVIIPIVNCDPSIGDDINTNQTTNTNSNSVDFFQLSNNSQQQSCSTKTINFNQFDEPITIISSTRNSSLRKFNQSSNGTSKDPLLTVTNHSTFNDHHTASLTQSPADNSSARINNQATHNSSKSKNVHSHWSHQPRQSSPGPEPGRRVLRDVRKSDAARRRDVFRVINGLDSIQSYSSSSLADSFGLLYDDDFAAKRNSFLGRGAGDQHHLSAGTDVVTEEEERYGRAAMLQSDVYYSGGTGHTTNNLTLVKTTLIPLEVPPLHNNNNNNNKNYCTRSLSLAAAKCHSNPQFQWNSSKVLDKRRGKKRIFAGYDSEYELEEVIDKKKLRHQNDEAANKNKMSYHHRSCYERVMSKMTNKFSKDSMVRRQERGDNSFNTSGNNWDLEEVEFDCGHAAAHQQQCSTCKDSENESIESVHNIIVDDEVSFRLPLVVDEMFSDGCYANNNNNNNVALTGAVTCEEYFEGGETYEVESSSESLQQVTSLECLTISSDIVDSECNNYNRETCQQSLWDQSASSSKATGQSREDPWKPTNYNNENLARETSDNRQTIGLLSSVYSGLNRGFNFFRNMVTSSTSGVVRPAVNDSAQTAGEEATLSPVEFGPSSDSSSSSSSSEASEEEDEEGIMARAMAMCSKDECKELAGLKQILQVAINSNERVTRKTLKERLLSTRTTRRGRCSSPSSPSLKKSIKCVPSCPSPSSKLRKDLNSGRPASLPKKATTGIVSCQSPSSKIRKDLNTSNPESSPMKTKADNLNNMERRSDRMKTVVRSYKEFDSGSETSNNDEKEASGISPSPRVPYPAMVELSYCNVTHKEGENAENNNSTELINNNSTEIINNNTNNGASLANNTLLNELASKLTESLVLNLTQGPLSDALTSGIEAEVSRILSNHGGNSDPAMVGASNQVCDNSVATKYLILSPAAVRQSGSKSETKQYKGFSEDKKKPKSPSIMDSIRKRITNKTDDEETTGNRETLPLIKPAWIDSASVDSPGSDSTFCDSFFRVPLRHHSLVLAPVSEDKTSSSPMHSHNERSVISRQDRRPSHAQPDAVLAAYQNGTGGAWKNNDYSASDSGPNNNICRLNGNQSSLPHVPLHSSNNNFSDLEETPLMIRCGLNQNSKAEDLELDNLPLIKRKTSKPNRGPFYKTKRKRDNQQAVFLNKKRLKVKRALANLTQDECKEFSKFDFHPRDVVRSFTEVPDVVMLSSKDEEEAPNTVERKSESGQHNASKPLACSLVVDTEPEVKTKRKFSQELRNLAMDECKEWKRSGYHPRMLLKNWAGNFKKKVAQNPASSSSYSKKSLNTPATTRENCNSNQPIQNIVSKPVTVSAGHTSAAGDKSVRRLRHWNTLQKMNSRRRVSKQQEAGQSKIVSGDVSDRDEAGSWRKRQKVSKNVNLKGNGFSGNKRAGLDTDCDTDDEDSDVDTNTHKKRQRKFSRSRSDVENGDSSDSDVNPETKRQGIKHRKVGSKTVKPLTKKMPMALKKLVSDECKEFQQCGFHPGDIVLSIQNNNNVSNGSSSGHDKPNLPQNYTSDSQYDDDRDLSERKSVGRKKYKLSREVRNLFLDECKEFKRRRSKPFSDCGLSSVRLASGRSARQLPTNKKTTTSANKTKKTAPPPYNGNPRNIRSCRIPSKVSMAVPTPRYLQRCILQTEGAMCVINCKLPDIT